MNKKYSVLFVCLGNHCRSPMAEAVFTHMVRERGVENRFNVSSAGTSSYHVGNKADPRAVQTCRQHGVPINNVGRMLTDEDYTTFDYILCMDQSNLNNVKEQMRNLPIKSKAIVKLFGAFDPQGKTIIEDPYYGDTDGFETNFQQITRCSRGLLDIILDGERHQITYE